MKNKKIKQQLSVTAVSSISMLSAEQKGNLAVWLYELYKEYYTDNNKLPTEEQEHEIIRQKFSKKLENKRIILPYNQIQLYYNSKLNGMKKKIEKEFLT